MKIERQLLIELAQHEAERLGEESDVISGYLIGSVAKGDPQLGGSADIDLVLIHDQPPESEREVVRLSYQVHLDIAHHAREQYSKPSDLRTHPWFGPSLCEPVFLYDPDHFFEWAQAGARGQYYRPDHMLQRSLAFQRKAQQAASLLPVTGRWIQIYLKAVMNSANAVASLTGFPVAGRRVGLELAASSQALEFPDLWGRFLSLLGADRLQSWSMPELLAVWAKTFDSGIRASKNAMISAPRRDYYLNAFQHLAEQDQGKAVLWPLLQTWEAANYARDGGAAEESLMQVWNALLETLHLSPDWHASRIEELARFLAANQSWIDNWGERHGA